VPLAQFLLLVMGGAAGVLLGAFAVLVVRRGWQESRSAAKASRGAVFRTVLLPLIARADDDAALSALHEWRRDPVALEVAGHLLQLMRGGERDKLMALVERLELLEPELARIRSRRAVRRIAAIRNLGNFPSILVGDALARCFGNDAEPAVRLEAGLALVRLQRLPTVAECLAALDDGSFATPAHRIVLRALAAQRPREMIDAWRACRGRAARLAVTDALGDVFDPAAFQALREALCDPDPQMRCEALRSMRRIGHPSLGAAVLAALGDKEWIVRVQAATTAGAMRLEGARKSLRKLRNDRHWWVRYRAEQALGMLPAAVTPARRKGAAA